MSYKTDKGWLLEHKHKGHKSHRYEEDLKRLNSGEPLDYIIGHSDFLNSKISLQGGPLIPRVETEFWVNEALQKIDKNASVNILDIFAGSGCIGIALLNNLPNSKVTFSELRPDLLLTIEENIALNLLRDREYKIIESDVFESVSGRFDYIFANPPYIDRDRDETDKSVLDHEPHSALFAEDNGLQYIKQLIIEAPNYLKKSGVLYIEFDSWQKEAISSFLSVTKHDYIKFDFIDDQYGITRVLRLSI